MPHEMGNGGSGGLAVIRAMAVVLMGVLLGGFAGAHPAVADSGCPQVADSFAGGVGSAVEPYQIATAAQFQRLQSDVSWWGYSYVLTADLDLSGCTWSSPIGGNQPFTGVLDGGWHTISGLAVSVTNTQESVGLFGNIANATIKRLTFSGSVYHSRSGTTTGGLVGQATTSTISDSAATGPVTVATQGGSSTGGLVGRLDVGSTLTGSRATGSVSVSGPAGGTHLAGGLVGYGQGATISKSYATGDTAVTKLVGASVGGAVPRGAMSVGGLVGGFAGHSITDCYSTGAVSANGRDNVAVGGLAGYAGGAVSNVYVTGLLTAPAGSLVGGLLGIVNGDSPFSASFWDTTTTGQSAATGFGPDAGATGLTTPPLQQYATFDADNWDIYDGWDVANTTTWGVYSAGYPFLRGQLAGVATSQTTIDAGGTPVGTSGPQLTLTITNAGGTALLFGVGGVTFTGAEPAPIRVTGVGAADFSVTADTCTGTTVLPGQACQVGVSFTPSAAGPASAELVLTSNAGNSPVTIPVTGQGLEPGLGTAPTAVDFGAIQVGVVSAAQVVTVTNTGQAPLLPAQVTLTGANATDFAISANTCTGATLAPAGTCQLTVAFQPGSAGTRTGSLVVASNAPGSPHTVSLSGNGATTPVIPAPAVTAAAGAVRGASRLRVSVANDTCPTNPGVRVQKARIRTVHQGSDGPATVLTWKWANKRTYRATGTGTRTVTINLPKGTYRAVVQPACAPASLTTNEVRLRK